MDSHPHGSPYGRTKVEGYPHGSPYGRTIIDYPNPHGATVVIYNTDTDFNHKVYKLINLYLEYHFREVIDMLKMKRVTETYDMRVFTDNGDYFGDVEESILTSNKVFGWRVKATKNSFLTKVLGSAKGVIVPHQLVKAIGDIMIINKTAIPSYDGDADDDE